MTTPDISRRATAALAALVHEARPDWDEAGVVTAIRRCPTVPLIDLGIAFLRAAADPANDTPAAVTYLDNRAWDTDTQPPCRTHPTAGRRTDGECGGCYADRRAVDTPIPHDRPGVPPRRPLRELLGDTRRSSDAGLCPVSERTLDG